MNWDGIVSLLFFCIEAVLLLNVLYFGRKVKLARKGALLIALLAGYQLTEYIICGLGVKSSFAAYIAFADISYLPPLGLLFVSELTGKKIPYPGVIFIPVTVLLIYYLFVIPQFQVVKCTVFYAVYSYPLGTLYGVFYYLPVFISIILLFYNTKSESASAAKNSRILLTGYIFVSLPVIAAFIMRFSGNEAMISMIESVMCKSALVLAVCYTAVILNLSREQA